MAGSSHSGEGFRRSVSPGREDISPHSWSGGRALTCVSSHLADDASKSIAIGDSYCYDSWCIGIEKVSATALLYNVDLHLFSDANGVSTSAKGTPVYVLDEHGHRWPLKPFDVTLDPHQSIHTSLTFLAPANAKQLFLTGDPAWHLTPSLYMGSDSSLLHKPALLVLKDR
jgi:hypothetical protein